MQRKSLSHHAVSFRKADFYTYFCFPRIKDSAWTITSTQKIAFKRSNDSSPIHFLRNRTLIPKSEIYLPKIITLSNVRLQFDIRVPKMCPFSLQEVGDFYFTNQVKARLSSAWIITGAHLKVRWWPDYLNDIYTMISSFYVDIHYIQKGSQVRSWQLIYQSTEILSFLDSFFKLFLLLLRFLKIFK